MTLLQFQLTFKRSTEVVAVVTGTAHPIDAFRVEDLAEKIIETEQYLERLTGLRVHIDQVL